MARSSVERFMPAVLSAGLIVFTLIWGLFADDVEGQGDMRFIALMER